MSAVLRVAFAALVLASLTPDADRVRYAQTLPDDEGVQQQWPLALMHMEQAWDVTTGDENLVVAVVDTGIYPHSDLRPRLVAGYDFISDAQSAGDGNGRDGDPTDEGDETSASSGFHGTHIAGIIGAATNNKTGMAGVDWRCRIQPVRALGVDHRSGRDSDIADAVRWAAGLTVPGVPQNKTPARVINLSFGGPGYSRLLEDAVLAAEARGALVIASAGNDGVDAGDNFPGALQGVLSVASAAPDGRLSSFSNFGPRVDLMAPGGGVFLDTPVGQSTPEAVWSTWYLRHSNQPVLAYASGSSQAAAHASGVAALVFAVAPALRPEAVASILRRASVMPAGGCAEGCGAGLIDASKAVTYAKQIAMTTCGSVGCGGTNALKPVPLRTPEGCSASGGRAGGDAWLVIAAGALLALAAVVRRRPRAAALLALGVSIQACGGSSSADETPPPTVRILDPIPTLDDRDLTVSVGAGRWITAEVTPVDHLEAVELRAQDPDQVLSRVGHGPFRFYVPEASPGRRFCITATHAGGPPAETCFLAAR